MSENFGTRLEEFMREKKFTSQEDFAKTFGATQKNITSWKNGSVPIGKTLNRLQEKYPDLNVNWLLTGKGQMVLDEPKRSLDDIDWRAKYYEALEELSQVWKEIANLRKGESKDAASKL